MDTFPVRLKWEGNPVAIVFRVDKDYFKGPPRLPFGMPNDHRLDPSRQAARLGQRWVGLRHQQRHSVT
jgi:hypothetical protein